MSNNPSQLPNNPFNIPNSVNLTSLFGKQNSNTQNSITQNPITQNSITQNSPTTSISQNTTTQNYLTMQNSSSSSSSLQVPSKSKSSPSVFPEVSNATSTAVPLFRSNSIDSDKFLPQSCLNQLIKDFYKSSSGSVNKKSSSSSQSRKRKRKTKKDESNGIKLEVEETLLPAPEQQANSTIRVSRETRELLPLLANEFIHYITTNATKICEESEKKTINHEHIVASLKRTNFTEYLLECQEVAKDANQQAAKRRKNSNRLENSGKSLEELEREQAAMFEAARLAMMAEYEQNVADAENVQQSGNAEDASCSVQLPDELADNDDYD